MFTKKKKQATVSIPTSWLMVGALLLATAVSAKAIYKSMTETAQIDEVRTPRTQDGTYTGIVSRESASDKGKENYLITTDDGAKYILIGLKKSYEDKNNNGNVNGAKTMMPADDDEPRVSVAPRANPTVRPSPKSSPKADADDITSFEQYVGKKVTIVGMVVPVGTGNTNRPEMSPKGNKPSVSPKAIPSPKPQAANYDRLVVKSITVVN